MRVYVVEYENMVVEIFDARKKAADYVTHETKAYMKDYSPPSATNFSSVQQKEIKKDYQKRYEIYKVDVK